MNAIHRVDTFGSGRLWRIEQKKNNNICIWENSVIFFFASNEGVFDSVILWFAFEKICLKTLMRLVFVWVKESVCVCVCGQDPRLDAQDYGKRIRTSVHEIREIAPLYLLDLFRLRPNCFVHCHWQRKKNHLFCYHSFIISRKSFTRRQPIICLRLLFI